MRLGMAFDPIESGEVDNFAFDFTADVGAATIASTNWTCALAPYQTATDPTPQARILSASAQTSSCAPVGSTSTMRRIRLKLPRSAVSSSRSWRTSSHVPRVPSSILR